MKKYTVYYRPYGEATWRPTAILCTFESTSWAFDNYCRSHRIQRQYMDIKHLEEGQKP